MKNRFGQFVIAFWLLTVGSVYGQFIVNSSNDVDDGVCNAVHCSLREAINEANSVPGMNTIGFDILPWGTVHTIQPNTPLPTITQPVKIKGYSQNGASAAILTSPATIKIVLDGGLAVSQGLQVTANNSVIRGLNIRNFNGDAVTLSGNYNRVEGNHIGTDVTGMLAESNFLGITITGSRNTIGGLNVAARNIISGNSTEGISIAAPNSNGNVIQGNHIGANANATAILPNSGIGVLVAWGHNNLIGNTSESEDGGNLIWGNSYGIDIANDVESTGNLIRGNWIGVDEAGNDRGNVWDGIICSGVSTQIGGTSDYEGNTIAFNGKDGVSVYIDGTGNYIAGNSIFSNAELGIDLNADEVTPNDPDDLDVGPNGLQNYPILNSATFDGTDLTVELELNSNTGPFQSYDLHFYANTECDSSGYGEGAIYITEVAGITNGIYTFTFPVPSAIVGKYITATATSWLNSTSEFSACLIVEEVKLEKRTFDSQTSKPEAYVLHQNYPNPFNPTTSLRFDIPKSSNVSIKVYNITGQIIRTLANRPYAAGQHEISWDGKNAAGQAVSSGTYIIKLVSGSFTQIRKMVLLR